MFRVLARLVKSVRYAGRNFLKTLQGTVNATGRLIALRHSLPAAESRQVIANDAMHPGDSVVVARASNSHIDAVRTADDLRSVAADISEVGSISSSIEGKSPRGEEDTQRVCEILIERLNRDGGCWVLSVRKPGAREDGIDMKACQGQEILNIQVTRIGTQTFWKTLGDQGRVANPSTVDASADLLRAAIERKKNVASSDLLLALDAINTPHYTLSPVVESFRRRHGSWAACVGFREIWVVGTVNDLVARLDIDGHETTPTS